MITKKKFKAKFLEDQHKYRCGTGFYNVGKSPIGKLLFNEQQLSDIKIKFLEGDSMTAIAHRYGCSRQTIRENLKRMGVL